MYVNFTIGYTRRFEFDIFNIPETALSCYFIDTEMYNYLNDNLTPSDIVKVCVTTVGTFAETTIIYNISDSVYNKMPDFIHVERKNNGLL